jgi:hypothetical protein
MEHVFNNGRLRVSNSSISYRPFLETIIIDRSKIETMHYKYDNIISTILSIPLGVIWCMTIFGTPTGLQFFRRSMLVEVNTRYERYEFWVHGKYKKRFKQVITN